jgi:hypothetical protein
MDRDTIRSQVRGRGILLDTLSFIDALSAEYGALPEALGMLRASDTTIELKKRYAIKSIDETWITVIEESLDSLDHAIRTPSRFIEETEQVLPIELSHNITSRSIQHLAQHTDYIDRIDENGNITPSKILNVFRDETIQTYENKFFNTLISKLSMFISRRYNAAKESGRDEVSTKFGFTSGFERGELRGKYKFEIEISEPPKSDSVNSQQSSNDLWSRVEKLYHITLAYTNSEFAQSMGKSYIRPPVMRTNAILKNKYLRQCLALWEFIESYDKTMQLEYISYELEKPRYTPHECRQLRLTYGYPLKLTCRLRRKEGEVQSRTDPPGSVPAAHT